MAKRKGTAVGEAVETSKGSTRGKKTLTTAAVPQAKEISPKKTRGKKTVTVAAVPSADESVLATEIPVPEGVVAVLDAGEAPKKKKKRSYANAYVRKGQGLNAIINEVIAEKNRLMTEQEAVVLATSAPAQHAALSTGDGEAGVVKEELSEVLAVQPEVECKHTTHAGADTKLQIQANDVVIPITEAALQPESQPLKKKRTTKSKAKPTAETGDPLSVVATELKEDLGQPAEPVTVTVKQEADNTANLGFGFTKAGKPRKRPLPAPKPIQPSEVKIEDPQGPPSTAEDASAAQAGDQGLGLTKAGKPRKRAAPRPKQDAVKAETAAQDVSIPPLAGDDARIEAVKAPKRRKAKQPKLEDEVKMEGEPKAEGEEKEGEQPKKKRRRGPDPNAFKIPGEEILDEALQMTVADRPVPNLGFACLNATLRAQKPPLFTNRGCIKKTFEEKGLDHISALALDNCKSIAGLVHWNHLNGIRFFRMSSCIFPWCSEWKIDQLKDKEEIRAACEFAGRLARAYDQRLTFHPTHFVKLGCEDGPLLDRSLHELEQHSLILDMMGYEPSPENKINIHIGGMYGDKDATLERFAKNFKRLSPNCQKRLTVENDDRGNSYSLKDLMRLHELIGVPLVFDFHHHRFCTGDLSEEEAFRMALTTWPKGVRPVVHWSESQEGRRPSAHSDFVQGPLRLYGLDDQVDVMIEAKGKELALLRLRDPTYTPSAAALALIYAAPE